MKNTLKRPSFWAAAIAAALLQAPLSTQAGLFKIDFGQLENERVPADADGNPSIPSLSWSIGT
ncbi:MAG: hypothetical protein ACKOKG_09665 [Verrucomicrobiota bacterium]